MSEYESPGTIGKATSDHIMTIGIIDCIRFVKYSFERGTGRTAKDLYLGSQIYDSLNENVRVWLGVPGEVDDPIATTAGGRILEMEVHKVSDPHYLSIA